ncbi:hypothetical protein [Streptomyces sp.]|uniref:hypothetical protein n=1 Tax=Streptomyces sp. TaxID=1931 RepID=UPI002F41EB83
MADMGTVLTVLLFLATGAAVLLGHQAMRYWRQEEAGRPYELPVDQRGIALRTGAAGATALVAITLAVTLPDARPTTPASPTVATVSRPTRTPESLLPTPPPPPSRTPEPAPPPAGVQTIGHPAGGTLQALPDGTRVWLPPRYDSARAAGLAYPVVLARVPAAGDPDLYDGFALQVRRRLADSFILALPRDCGHDSGAVLAEVARRYRVLTARTAQAVLGIGPEAPCAVREALAHPSRYTAAVGVSGTYPALAPAPGLHPSLLLATASGETAPRDSARALRKTLRSRGGDVRVLDGISRRRQLFALVASYFTEKLDGPARVAPTNPPRTSAVLPRLAAVPPRPAPPPPPAPHTRGPAPASPPPSTTAPPMRHP